MTELELKLDAKAKRVLRNPNEVDEELVVLSLGEAKELTDNKPIKETLLLDLALLRLKTNLKIELSEHEEKYYLSIIKQAQNMPVASADGQSSGGAVSGKRESVWDM